MPQEIPKARREWRQRRRQQSRARYGLRRLLGMLSILLVLLVGILFLPALIGQRPVARLHVPTAEAVPKPPVTEPQADSRASSQTGSEASTPTVPVKTELTAERKDPLRDELQRIARAYPATYGVVIFDPSSKETLAMGADQKFGAACLGKLPVLMALYRVAAGQVDLDDKISMQYSDVQAYGTGVLYTYLIGYTMTLRECAEFLIKKSDNTAWKMLDRYLGRDYIRAELYRAGARSSQYWLPNTTTPNDVLLMLEKMSNRSYTPPTPSRKDAGLAQGRLLRQHLRPRRSDLSRRRDTKDAYFIEDAYFIVVMASETGWGTSRAATQEMSLATYRILSEPTPEGESNG